MTTTHAVTGYRNWVDYFDRKPKYLAEGNEREMRRAFAAAELAPYELVALRRISGLGCERESDLELAIRSKP